MATFKRTARKGETGRAYVILNGIRYVPASSPSFIVPGRRILVQPMQSEEDVSFGGKPYRVLVAHVGSEGWERFEREDV